MVQTELGPLPAPRYKDEPVDDHIRHSAIGHSGLHNSHLQHPRSGSLAQPPKQSPGSPLQPTTSLPGAPSAPYASQALGNSILQHPTTHYAQPTHEQNYYSSNPPYSTASASGQYSSSGLPDIMASTAQMQRPYPPIYHTPQSSSPASVASQTHDQHSRGLYAQSPQMAPQMYGYQPYPSINPVQPPPYTAHTSSQQHPLTSQSMILPHTSTAQLSHQPPQAPSVTMASSPIAVTASQQTPPQRAVMSPPHSASAGGPLSANSIHHTTPSVGASSSAAPGPIPATTPLVVRQDSNGVQWIAFEYSRDRVKMEYTIRCDVESVNVDNLSQEFKTENCVYPRACCSKDQYKGNRLVYETECNAVGWALADLNPALRGKRGLIQRAVDSWRNSNQDPRLRSRRVRRMAKLNRRQGLSAQPPTHMAAASPVPQGISGGLAAPSPRPGLGPLPMGPPQLHHHHAQPEGSGSNEDVSGTTEFSNSTDRQPGVEAPLTSGHTTTDIRTAQVFHGYPTFPTSASAGGGSRGPSIPPLIRDSGLGSLGRHSAVATSVHKTEVEDDDDERNPSHEALFGALTDGMRRKFILVDDPQRGCRVRVKVMLDQVNLNEIPDSYRMSNSVYPRTYFPVQMKHPRGREVPGRRYFKDDHQTDDDQETATVGRVLVPVPQADDGGEIAVPKLTRGRHRKEVLLNDLGYRMSWSQSRVFAGRPLFLQRSLKEYFIANSISLPSFLGTVDAYRNKMRSTMLAAGHDPSSIPRHLETRAGKRRFLERRQRQGTSASQRSAEEVEA
ncbi:hypothetical protein KXV81_003111 [Aspergillus fumigatus]|nr:hypothetical protein CNMCM8689_003438 [Aspergillus fumigatus]KAH1303910.1 hypothetical protein KXX11_001593 [Aspergillus fumigatus]KAH1339046.1 hypothetical protein KXX67_009366 [Aspergillus fumigatus]KAH1388869.1 hypothetical protein KXX49_003719 [Aspergillus fumigatus]KAH1393096.1 hypothetical protein KXX50_008770 [Aspergillus fumigatus]